jgi:acyl carrier protein
MSDVLTQVRQAFKSSFDVEPDSINLKTTPAQIPAWDSVGHLTLVGNLESAFGISLEVDELMAMESVEAIVRIIEKKTAGK